MTMLTVRNGNSYTELLLNLSAPSVPFWEMTTDTDVALYVTAVLSVRKRTIDIISIDYINYLLICLQEATI